MPLPPQVARALQPARLGNTPALDVEQRIAHRAVAEPLRFVAELKGELEGA